MRFAFFHGDPFTVIIIPGLIALVVWVAVIVSTALLFYFSLKQKKVPALYFPLPYIIPVALLLVLLVFSTKGSDLYIVSYVSSFFLTLPWSALGLRVLRSLASPGTRVGDSIALLMAGAGLNTLILYGVGIVARVLKGRKREVSQPTGG